ncbi:MAG: hypothetical protein U0U66_10795 [Cytophagaceae bacterium]
MNQYWNIFLVLFFIGCQSTSIEKPEKDIDSTTAIVDTMKVDSLSFFKDSLGHLTEEGVRFKVNHVLTNSTPVFGYRFVIYGDFNGDHVQDTLVEHYMDSLYQKEEPKFYQNPNSDNEYGNSIFINSYFNRKSYLGVTFTQAKLNGSDFGFHYVENCGDLNCDGKDEILVVKQHADYSNLNHAYIYTFKKGAWQLLWAIPVREWQFPPTPGATMTPGMFGNYSYESGFSDSLNLKLEQQLKTFRFIQWKTSTLVELEAMAPLYETYYEKHEKEFELLGEEGFIKKYFTEKYFNDTLYLKDKQHPYFYYQAARIEWENREVVCIPFDPASSIVMRIEINKNTFK